MLLPNVHDRRKGRKEGGGGRRREGGREGRREGGTFCRTISADSWPPKCFPWSRVSQIPSRAWQKTWRKGRRTRVMDPEWRKVRWKRETRKDREAERREGRVWLQ